VLFLIVDLDRAHEGLLRVGQQAMLDLQAAMKPPRPLESDDSPHGCNRLSASGIVLQFQPLYRLPRRCC
jgi:hypothetical protein